MKRMFAIHPFKLIEETLHREDMRLAESLTSLGNAHMGMRGNFEEAYSGDCHRGTYLAGVWFPDKTRVGWWKNGYPEFFGKVPNAINMLEIGVFVDGEEIDLAKNKVVSYYRELDMERGVLLRRATLKLAKGDVDIEIERFLSIARKEILAIRYRVRPSFAAEVVFAPALDANVRNEDANYGEVFWVHEAEGWESEIGTVTTQTRENPYDVPRFTLCAAMEMKQGSQYASTSGRVSCEIRQNADAERPAELNKIVAVDTSRNHKTQKALKAHVIKMLSSATAEGYEALRAEQEAAWRARWDAIDITIGHDMEAQQGIRYNLFQFFSTYDGTDPGLNIGPKGFTGEKYGGATYWDTEMFCLPMVLSLMGANAAKNLLLYRYLHLEKAKENARRLGCEGALYPMVTFDGAECHNEWEITFEEIHRNAAIVYAIYLDYQHNGRDGYIREQGFAVMLEIARYFLSRLTFNEKKRSYMILGVTGPNEYENNINNNWYTNRMARFCLELTAKYARTIVGEAGYRHFHTNRREIARFERIATKIYLPHDKKHDIFLQQDGFMDKEIIPASVLDPADRPLCQHWSWDRILRSCYIKQADVLQGLYCLRHEYDLETIRRNFAFYEPLTVHESSLSPCVHAVLAAMIGEYEKAMQMYHKTARLDLDNLNNDTEDGLHITSMAGSFIAIVYGFAGIQTEGGSLKLAPRVPHAFRSFSFGIRVQGRALRITIDQGVIALELREGPPISVQVYDKWYTITPGADRRIKLLYQQNEEERT